MIDQLTYAHCELSFLKLHSQSCSSTKLKYFVNSIKIQYFRCVFCTAHRGGSDIYYNIIKSLFSDVPLLCTTAHNLQLLPWQYQLSSFLHIAVLSPHPLQFPLMSRVITKTLTLMNPRISFWFYARYLILFLLIRKEDIISLLEVLLQIYYSHKY